MTQIHFCTPVFDYRNSTSFSTKLQNGIQSLLSPLSRYEAVVIEESQCRLRARSEPLYQTVAKVALYVLTLGLALLVALTVNLAWRSRTTLTLEEKGQKAEPEIKVELDQVTQYTIAANDGNHPSACSFHALQAVHVIGNNFDCFANRIVQKETDYLTQLQTRIIRGGLSSYEEARKKGPDLIKGANLDMISSYANEMGIPFQAQQTLDDPRPFNVNPVIDHLFLQDDKTRFALLKTGNEESFAVIARGNRAILFDSHHSSITLFQSRAQAAETLTKKLREHSNEMDGLSLTPFHYALGNLLAPFA